MKVQAMLSSHIMHNKKRPKLREVGEIGLKQFLRVNSPSHNHMTFHVTAHLSSIKMIPLVTAIS